MKHLLLPTYTCRSIYDISPEQLVQAGIRGVIFDIDNTLVPHDAPADSRAVRLFEDLRGAGLKTCLISNNDRDRVQPFADAVGSPYRCKVLKPSRKGYLAAMEEMETAPEETLFVGDQIYTDILGSNLSGVRSLLVRPIQRDTEIQIILKRILELPVMFFIHFAHRKKL